MIATLLILAAAFSVSLSARCDGDWMQYGDKCYKFLPEQDRWEFQITRCMYQGATLAGINNHEENEVIRSLTDGRDIYLGLCTTFGRNWHWIDQSPYDYRNWKNGAEPMVTRSRPCGIMTSDGKWTNACCVYHPSPVVCVKSANQNW